MKSIRQGPRDALATRVPDVGILLAVTRQARQRLPNCSLRQSKGRRFLKAKNCGLAGYYKDLSVTELLLATTTDHGERSIHPYGTVP